MLEFHVKNRCHVWRKNYVKANHTSKELLPKKELFIFHINYKEEAIQVLFFSLDPEVHPQNEDYWGHVNPIGPRACYDEGKRVAETMCYAYMKQVLLVIRFLVFALFSDYKSTKNWRVLIWWQKGKNI